VQVSSKRYFHIGEIKVGRPKINGICIECDKQAVSKGRCAYHYNKKRIEDDPSKANSGLRGHSLYITWFERKANNDLCEAWLNFETFIQDVSEKPKEDGKFFVFAKLRINDLFSSDNYQWLAKKLRDPNDTDTEHWAKKWQAQRVANPTLNRARNYQKKFGLSFEEAGAILKSYNYSCAICGNEETAIDGRTGLKKNLALDHCHATDKLREPLCWRCNATLGKVKDSVELLQKMIDYLNKHKENINV